MSKCVFVSVKSCGDPGDVLDGSRQGEVFTFGNEIVHQCDLGYELRGSAWRVCQADGMWSGIHPTCEREYDCDGLLEY